MRSPGKLVLMSHKYTRSGLGVRDACGSRFLLVTPFGYDGERPTFAQALRSQERCMPGGGCLTAAQVTTQCLFWMASASHLKAPPSV